jgi:hypothetical protein
MPVNAAVVDQAKQLTGKLTQQWTPQVHTSLMYAWYQSFEPDARFFGGGLFENGADPGDGALERRVNFLALNQGWAINNRSLLQVRYGLNRFLDDNRGADFDPATLGFDPAFIAAVPYKKFPNVSALDYGQGGALLGDRDRQRGVFSAHAVSGVFHHPQGSSHAARRRRVSIDGPRLRESWRQRLLQLHPGFYPGAGPADGRRRHGRFDRELAARLSGRRRYLYKLADQRLPSLRRRFHPGRFPLA